MRKCKACGAAMEVGDRFCGECGADQNASLAGMMTLGGLETLDETQTRVNTREPMPELPEGAEFAGRYIVQQVVGKGGMGVVYRAHDKLAEKDVALKLIRADRLSGPASVRRLISEGITARDIRHTNIVAVYDVGEADGQPFVSMEYLKGQSLRDWHREKIRQREDVPLRVAARIMAEVLDGLAAAHGAGVIHRDLKPENIMLVGDPTDASAPLKILDFGIARAAGAGMDSGTGTGLGTPRYMAPEQVTNPDTAGPPADLYSLSVIFYELLVDVLPQGHWQPPSGGRSDVPPGIDRLIERGLANRPANRPQTAQEYRKAMVDAVNLNAPPMPRPRPVGPDHPDAAGPDWRGVMKWGAIGLGILFLIAIMATTVDGGSSGGDYPDFIPPKEPEKKIGPVLPPEPPPPPPLSGLWINDNGVSYTMRVANDGSFSGAGTNAYGFLVQISGRFSGVNATFDLVIPNAGMSYTGRMVWDRQCHLSYQLFDPANNLADRGLFHVNHPPGAPCP